MTVKPLEWDEGGAGMWYTAYGFDQWAVWKIPTATEDGP